MSFEQWGNGGTPSRGGFQPHQSPFSGQIAPSQRTSVKNTEDDDTEAITNQIKSLANNVQQIKTFSNLIGTNKDSSDMRQRLNSLIDTTKNLIKETAQNLKHVDYGSSASYDNKKRLVHQKLAKDFQSWGQVFQEISKISAEKERANPVTMLKNTKPDIGRNNYNDFVDPNVDEEKQGLLSQPLPNSDDYQMKQMEDERMYNAALIESRQQSIKEIEKSVQEVHEIFVDLANLVSEQGGMIDNIESNVESAVDHTEQGVTEVRKASEYQKSSRSKLCCLVLLTVIILVAVIIFIAVFLGLKP